MSSHSPSAGISIPERIYAHHGPRYSPARGAYFYSHLFRDKLFQHVLKFGSTVATGGTANNTTQLPANYVASECTCWTEYGTNQGTRCSAINSTGNTTDHSTSRGSCIACAIHKTNFFLAQNLHFIFIP